MKVVWIVFVILLPFLGVFVYIISQGHHMAERDMKQAQASQAQFDDYVKSVAGGGAASEIEKANALLASGAITQAEFDELSARRWRPRRHDSDGGPATARRPHSNALIANAVAKPSVVTTPTHLPPFAKASGIIVSASIVGIAPPANARTNATTEGEAESKRPNPARAASPETATIPTHSSSTRELRQPDALRPAVAATASGRLERKTAASIATLTVPPSQQGETEDGGLGDPVEHGAEDDRERRPAGARAFHVLALGAAQAVDDGVAERVDRAAREQPRRDVAEDARGVERLLDELERHRAEEDARAEAHHEPEDEPVHRDAERERRADEERGAREGPPPERLEHRLGGGLRCHGLGRRPLGRRADLGDPCSVRLRHLEDDDLERRGDRHRDERAEHAEERAEQRDAEDDEERRRC